VKFYAFAVSHFCEKARWALDLKGVPYTYRALAPGLHVLTTRRLGLPHTWVPILEDDRGIVQGSSQIIDYLEAHFPEHPLTPDCPTLAQEVRAWEEDLDRRVGEDMRRVLYDLLLDHPDLLLPLWRHQTPPWTGLLYRATYPLITTRVRRLYKITPTSVTRSAASFAEIIGKLDRRLEDHPFLVGDTLTRADITAAALLAPMVFPKNHPMPWPELPPSVEAFTAAYRDGPTWSWVERLYAAHR